jgi:hypothetical protein
MLRFPIFAIALAAAGTALAADPTFPPGSRIGLVPPGNMTVARGMSGFQDAATGSAIVTMEMPAEAFTSIAAGFTDEGLKAQGFTAKSRDKVKLGSNDGTIVAGEQTENGRSTQKAILLTGDGTLTALVIAQYPANATKATVDGIKAALKTVALRAPLTIEQQVGALPFKVGDMAGFRAVRAMSGNAVLLTDGPKDVVREAEQPIMIVAQSFAPGPATPEQRDAFARQALAASGGLKDGVYERAQGFRLGGSEWHEIVAKGKDAASGQPVIVMQSIRFAPDGYLRMLGVAREEKRDDVMPRFRRVVDSITQR